MQFIAKNIRDDPQALEELLRLGGRATPVTVIDREVIVERGRVRAGEGGIMITRRMFCIGFLAVSIMGVGSTASTAEEFKEVTLLVRGMT